MTAIITGSDSGIGKATAVEPGRRGHDIAITYSRDEEGARATAEEVRSLGRRAEVRHLDLTQTDAVQPAIDELAEALGGSDVLVNNAGTDAGTPFVELELARWRDVLDVDLTGALLTAQAAARLDGRARHARADRQRDLRARARAARGRDAVRRRRARSRRADEDDGARARRARDHGQLGRARRDRSPEASYTTGASYVVDGGMLLMAAQANLIAQG